MQIKGNVVVEGVAIGTLQFLNTDYEKQIEDYVAGEIAEEKGRYQEALESAKEELAKLLEKREQLAESEVEILEAHQLFLEDITLEDAVMGYLEQKMPAPLAVRQAVEDFKAMFESIDDDYLRERQNDIVDVGNRILRKLLHMKEFAVEGDCATYFSLPAM